MILKRGKKPARDEAYLEGQMLVAMPGMPDQRFARAVIYICAHSVDGAMGIIVNRKARKITLQDLLSQLDLVESEGSTRLPRGSSKLRVLHGGPVDTQRGFVLHSPDYHGDDSTLVVDDDVSLTATIDILRAIIEGDGPNRAILALGYAGWSPGQLEAEIQNNGWLTCPADPGLLFDDDLDGKYARALGKLGIDPANLVRDAGRA